MPNTTSQLVDPASGLVFKMNLKNETEDIFKDGPEYYMVFDKPLTRAILILLYSAIFIFSFFGNLAVVLVTTLHWRMRKKATFCIFNLAIANLCVAIFCVYQNLSLYLMESWIFGNFMCKMYFFIMSLSYTASILILVVISIERYIVITYPFVGRQLMTMRNLQITIMAVWILSIIICFHRFYSVSTSENSLPGGDVEIICSPNLLLHNHKAVDLTNFLLLFLLPLVVISILYIRVGLYLQNCSKTILVTPSTITIRSKTEMESLDWHLKRSGSDSCSPDSDSSQVACSSTNEEMNTNNNDEIRTNKKTLLQVRELENGVELIRLNFSQTRRRNIRSSTNNAISPAFLCFSRAHTLNQLLLPRANHKAVIRMLIVIVITFALCNFPFYMWKICQHYLSGCNLLDHPLFDLVTPATFLIKYANCAINPFIYAIMHRRFRVCLVELLSRPCQSIKRRHQFAH